MEYEVGDWFISFTSRFLALTAYFGVTNKYLLFITIIRCVGSGAVDGVDD